MKVTSVSIQELYGLKGGRLDCIHVDCPLDMPFPDWKRPAVLVIPGGAYAIVSKREGEPVAHAFLSRGFQAFILTYACAPDGVRYPEQLLEAAAAVDYIKKHAQEYHVDPDAVFIVGFSAGGHLTANLATEYSLVHDMTEQELDCRPTAVGLCYPVISCNAGHINSFHHLLNRSPENTSREQIAMHNLDIKVSSQTPPAFIWSTAEDTAVPSENALLYALALARNNIPYELHIYPKGEHGLSTCDKEINSGNNFLKKNSQWVDDCTDFFRMFTSIPF